MIPSMFRKAMVGDGSTLTLDFTTGVLDPRLTFTRTTNATFINSQGLVQWADANMIYNSVWTDANNVPSAWSAGSGTPSRTDDTRTFTTSASQVYITQTRDTQSGIRYTASIEVTAVTGTQRIDDVIVALGGSSYQYYLNGSAVSGTTTLTTGIVGVAFTAGAATTTVRVGSGVQGTSTTGAVTLRYPQFEPSTVASRTYRPNSSTTAPYQAPRFDYDPTTLAPRGLLVEGTATNICLNGSMAYTATAPTSWTRGFSGCTVASVDSTTFPGQKAWSISATASGQRDLLEQVIALAANTTYTVSVYLEAVTGTVATFAYMTSLPAGATSNTVVNPSAGRISFTVTVAATAGNGTLRIGIGTATGTGVSADASVRFSHVQVETGEGASSYIPTGASQATRALESCVMTGTNFSSWFAGATEGVLYTQFEKPRSQSGTIGHDHAAVGSQYGSGTAFIVYAAASVYYPTTLLWPTGGVLFPGGIASAIPNVSKQAGKWFGGNDATNYANGVQGTTSAGTGTLAPNMLTIGANSASGTAATRDWLNACVRTVKFWPVALPDSQIIALTTP